MTLHRLKLPNGLRVACWDVGPFQKGGALDSRLPPLVLLHGIGGDRREWWLSMPVLAQRRRLLAFDLLAHGLSDTPDRNGVDYRIRLLSNVVVDAIRSLPRAPESVDLLGHSLGGAIALDLALRFPRLIRRLVLVDSAGPHPGEALSPLSASLVFAPRNFTEARRLLRSSVRSPWLGNAFIAWITSISKRKRHNHPELVKILASAAAGEDAISYPELRRITHPTLVLWGADDQIFPSATGRRLAAALPHSELRIVPRSGHVLPVERPIVFARHVSDFLAATIPAED